MALKRKDTKRPDGNAAKDARNPVTRGSDTSDNDDSDENDDDSDENDDDSDENDDDSDENDDDSDENDDGERDSDENDDGERDSDDSDENDAGERDSDDADSDPGETPPEGALGTETAEAVDADSEEGHPRRGRSAPLWILAVYLGGLVLVFLGQRVFGAGGWLSIGASVLGVAAVAMGTTLRYSPRFRVGGQRKQIESWLGALSITGLVAILLYFTTTDWLAEKLGLFRLGEASFDRVMGLLSVAWISLILISVVPLVFAETAAYPMRHAVRPESRRVRFAALSGLSLSLALVYCALFVYAARGADVSADYSYFKTSEPSESTRKIVETLDEPVLVRAFFPQVNEVRDEVERYLRTLARDNPKLQVEITDRYAEPDLARELRVTQDGTIVLEQGKAHEQVRIGDDIEKAQPKLRTLDGDFQEKLLKLVRSRRTAYLTIGHGEINDVRGRAEVDGRGASIVKELLRRQNFAVKDLGLSEGLGREIPDDASLVLVLGPAEPLAPEEIASLKAYADRGGKLLVAIDPDAETATEAILPGQLENRFPEQGSEPPDGLPAAPGESSAASTGSASAPPAPSAAAPSSARPASAAPDAPPAGTEAAPVKPAVANDPNAELAAALGLLFDGTVLANDRDHMRVRFNQSDRVRLGTQRFSSHASVSTLSRYSSQGARVVFDGAGSLEALPGSGTKPNFAVRSMPNTFRDSDRDYRFDGGSEKRADFNLAAAVSAPVQDGKKPKKKSDKAKKDKEAEAPPLEMRAFVVADSAVFTDLLMSRVVGNQLLLVDAVRWLAGEESIMGEISTEEDRPIEHTKQEDLLWFYATIFGAPALVLGIGFWLGRRPSRNKKKGAKQ